MPPKYVNAYPDGKRSRFCSYSQSDSYRSGIMSTRSHRILMMFTSSGPPNGSPNKSNVRATWEESELQVHRGMLDNVHLTVADDGFGNEDMVSPKVTSKPVFRKLKCYAPENSAGIIYVPGQVRA